MSLYDVVKSTHGSKKHRKQIENAGYIYDSDLSTDEYQTFYNPKTKKMLFSVRGTSNWNDVLTDASLLFGRLKETDRYKRAKSGLEIAKDKYSDRDNTSVVGFSLGGGIADGIASRNDNITLYNPGKTIGSNVRGNNYRVSGDIVSLLTSNNKNTTTLPKPNRSFIGSALSLVSPSIGAVYNGLQSHSSNNIKDLDVYV
jgi:hypothetical protein